MPDVVYLRSCLALGALLGGTNNAVRLPPNWTEVRWAAAFLVVNAAMIVKILRERMEVEFSCEELDLFDTQCMQFSLSPRHFSKLLHSGRWVDLPEGATVSRQGEQFEQVVMLAHGALELHSVDGKVATMRHTDQGAIVGAASFLEKSKAVPEELSVLSVTVVGGPAKLLVWESKHLRELICEDSRLGLPVVRMLSASVAAKLRHTTTSKSFQTYTEVLLVCLADQRVPPEEKKAIREYRARYGITTEQHLAALEVAGWTEEEFSDGAKHSGLGVGERLLRVLQMKG